MHPKKKPRVGTVAIDFGKMGIEFVKTAADLLGLKTTDFVRLSVSFSLGSLYPMAFDASAARAFHLFRTKAQGALHQRLDRIDFDEEQVQKIIAALTVDEGEWMAPKLRHKIASVEPRAGYPGLSHSASGPDRHVLDDVWYKNMFSQSIHPTPHIAERDWAVALHRTLLIAVGLNPAMADNNERQRAKTFVKSILLRQVKFDFDSLKVQYQAIPGLHRAIQMLVYPVPPEIRQGAWNDPIALYQYLCWLKLPGHASKPYDELLVSLTQKEFDPRIYRAFIQKS